MWIYSADFLYSMLKMSMLPLRGILRYPYLLNQIITFIHNSLFLINVFIQLFGLGCIIAKIIFKQLIYNCSTMVFLNHFVLCKRGSTNVSPIHKYLIILSLQYHDVSNPIATLLPIDIYPFQNIRRCHLWQSEI